jgi:hypothetical protein
MRIFLYLLFLFFSSTCHAIELGDLSNRDVVSGLKEALNKGTANAVSKLGKENGFFGNDKVKIPLPDSLRKVDDTLRRFGMGKYADELVLTMNRAAETAVPEARSLLVDAVKQMTIQDAKGILTGGDTSATEYFQRKTSRILAAKFLPVVKKSTEKVGVAQKYSELAQGAARFGLIDESQADLDNYITQKALSGLYTMIADEEKEIRAHPVEQGSKLLSKVFGSLLEN